MTNFTINQTIAATEQITYETCASICEDLGADEKDEALKAVYYRCALTIRLLAAKCEEIRPSPLGKNHDLPAL